MLAMVSGAAIARRAARALPSILHRNYGRSSKEWIEQGVPSRRAAAGGGLLRTGSTNDFELASPLAPMLKESKERVYASTLAYAVRRRDPELIGPAAQTPRETKRLSDFDDPDALRMHVSVALFYRSGKDTARGDPAGVIRRALGEALVQYYPLAGRLREIDARKLVVDCTGEGVLFVEADAQVGLADLEAVGLRPPFPGWDQLLMDVEGSRAMLNSPLMLIQVTRLLCGGFVLALRVNHTICDGIGLVQFMNAVTELARGLPTTVTPAWSRELLEARNPHMSSSPHSQLSVRLPPPVDELVMRSFIFRASDVAAIKESLPLLLRDTTTTFEALAALLWRARTAALEVPPGEKASLVVMANFRGATKLSLPAGYYGNACAPSAVLVDAAALQGGSLGDTVALVRLAKSAVTTDYVRSMADELVLLGRRWLMPPNMFLLSDTRSIGFGRLDFGWGEPVYAGPANTIFGISYFIAVKDSDGEDAVAVPVVLPRLPMDRFTAEVERSLTNVKPCHTSVT